MVAEEHTLIERHVMTRVRDDLETFRVVLVNGPRQCGKTTLIEQLHTELGGRYTSLDRPADFAGAREDPIGFVAQPGRPMFIDEVQRGGDDLVRAIKLAVDEDSSF